MAMTEKVTPSGGPVVEEPVRRSRWRIDTRYQPVLGTLVVLVAMLVIGGSRYDNFLSGRVMANLLINNSFLVVLAVGMTFVILTGGIDLSVGAVVALSGMHSGVDVRQRLERGGHDPGGDPRRVADRAGRRGDGARTSRCSPS